MNILDFMNIIMEVKKFRRNNHNNNIKNYFS